MSRTTETGLSGLKAKIQDLQGPILVLGASGFIGANLLRTLSEYRDDVSGTACVLPAWRLHALPERAVRLVDVLDDAHLDSLLNAVDPKTIFDCIAYGAYQFETDAQRIYETNFRFLTRLLPRLAGRGIAMYVHAGTSSEYGTNAAGPDEQDYAAPNSDYAVSKIAAAHLIYLFGKRRRLPCSSLRLYSVYGPFEDSSRLVPQLIRNGIVGRLPDFVNPEISRDFLYVEDAVASFVHAALYLDKEYWGESFNIGTGREITIGEVAAFARDLFHIEAQPTFTMPARDWDVSHWFANIDRARLMLRWAPTVDFRQGLGRTMTWYQALDDKDGYVRNSKRNAPMESRPNAPGATAPIRSGGARDTAAKEKQLFNLNSLSNGADHTLLDFGHRCLDEFDGLLIGVDMGVK